MRFEEIKMKNTEKLDEIDLVQRKTVQINPNISREERVLNLNKQLKNPNHYLEGETVVKLVFSEINRSLEDCIKAILKDI